MIYGCPWSRLHRMCMLLFFFRHRSTSPVAGVASLVSLSVVLIDGAWSVAVLHAGCALCPAPALLRQWVSEPSLDGAAGWLAPSPAFGFVFCNYQQHVSPSTSLTLQLAQTWFLSRHPGKQSKNGTVADGGVARHRLDWPGVWLWAKRSLELEQGWGFGRGALVGEERIIPWKYTATKP